MSLEALTAFSPFVVPFEDEVVHLAGGADDEFSGGGVELFFSVHGVARCWKAALSGRVQCFRLSWLQRVPLWVLPIVLWGW
ncbi:hypothetical protein [Desulfurispirillum indicum]|uniref:hypothetical protein n=1 Tax=Desulfurispirillum indicum TaxID=936456 RepID=UPI0012E9A409|nr:hypothetical protein [Desulfurispirillum indicum]